jgi:hypothetical protein
MGVPSQSTDSTRGGKPMQVRYMSPLGANTSPNADRRPEVATRRNFGLIGLVAYM